MSSKYPLRKVSELRKGDTIMLHKQKVLVASNPSSWNRNQGVWAFDVRAGSGESCATVQFSTGDEELPIVSESTIEPK